MTIGLGYFPASRFPLLGAALVAAGLIICQIVAYYMGHEELFPQSSIYLTARHAPEYVFFRISVICGATLFLLTWLINFAFFNEVCPKANVFSGIVTFVGIAASLTQMLAAATIDTGNENAHWVYDSKTVFAILSGAAIVLNTGLSMYVRRLNKGVKKGGVQIKLVLTVVLLVFGYQAYILIGGESPARFIVEYGYVFTILCYYWSMSGNYKKYIIDYELTA